MVQWDAPRSPTGALFAARLGEEKGVDFDECLRGTGLSQRMLSDPHTEVSASQELAVIGNVVKALGNPPGLGIEAGSRLRLSSFGIWGFALISSPTVRSAIDVGLQFIDLTVAFSDIRARRVGDEMRLVVTCREIAPELQRFVVEREVAAIQTIQRDLFDSPLGIDRVSLAFPEPPADRLPVYDELFGVRPEFDAPESAWAINADLLDAPLPQANELTTAMALAQCRELLELRKARSGVSGQVRDILLGNLSDPPDAARVAAELHMSDRTLRHRLAEEGTSFRALLDEVRERLAEELLLTNGLTVAETAERLGYLEVSSFSHAFRRWKGMGPRAYRRHTAVVRAR